MKKTEEHTIVAFGICSPTKNILLFDLLLPRPSCTGDQSAGNCVLSSNSLCEPVSMLIQIQYTN